MTRRLLVALSLILAAPSLAATTAPSPVSLTSSEGVGLQIVSMTARAVIEDPLAFTELHLVFHNPEARPIEGQFSITLPPGAAVSRFAMRQSWGWQEGEVVELEAARQAYEDFLHRRQDPALLEKQPGNQFHARVFPIAASSDKELIISYSQELVRTDEPYRLLLRGLPKLGTLDIKVLVGKRSIAAAQSTLGGTRIAHESVEVQKRDFVPDVDFAVPLPPSDAGDRLGLRHENLAVARITPVTEVVPDRPDSLLILFDSSASRALGYAAALERLVALIAQLKSSLGAELPLKVVCFDQEVAEAYTGTLGGFGRNHVGAMRERRAQGASDLRAALTYVATLGSRQRKWSRVLLVSDGIATAGPTDGAALQAAARALAQAGVRRIDAIAAGGIRDEAGLKRIVVALPQAGVVIDDELAPEQAVKRLGQATFSNIRVSVPGAAWAWPQTLAGVQPGDEVLVYADLPAGKPLEVVLEGARAGKHPVKLAPVARPLLERAWVGARIQRLEAQRQALGANDPDLSEALKKQIVDLSTKFRVLCDHTALLVLETEQDYARFHIDRRALADILVVGADGAAVTQRSAITYATDGRAIDPTPVQRTDETKRRDEDPARVVAKPPTSVERARGEDRDDAAREAPSAVKNVEREAPSPRRAAEPRPSAGASDRDGDGIPDAVDRCPNEPETYNGIDDQDGCPDRARVVVTQSSISILDRVYFASGDGKVEPVSFPVLDAVAATLRANPQLTLVEIQGHTDEREPGRVAGRRVDAVKRYLVQKGVDARRLVTRTFGHDHPICARHEPDCWERNRRVEFVILQRDGVAVPIGPSPPQPEQRKAPYTGKLADVMTLLDHKKTADALKTAIAWHDEAPGDVLSLIALGEALEASGKRPAAARAYGSLIDLFPGRADLRRFAGERLERLGPVGLPIAIDTYRQARTQRPDHPASHRLLAYALVRVGDLRGALDVIVEGARRVYPEGRFAGVGRILNEDVALITAALAAKEPNRRAELEARVRGMGIELADSPSLRFVLNWETDANDVDFHIFDARAGHAYYRQRELASGGVLYADVTTGYGPECFTVSGTPSAYPYRLQAHYYSRGPMGYGMGKLEIIQHDGHGKLLFEERPFVIMADQAFVDLGIVQGPLK